MIYKFMIYKLMIYKLMIYKTARIDAPHGGAKRGIQERLPQRPLTV